MPIICANTKRKKERKTERNKETKRNEPAFPYIGRLSILEVSSEYTYLNQSTCFESHRLHQQILAAIHNIFFSKHQLEQFQYSFLLRSTLQPVWHGMIKLKEKEGKNILV
jgi:hypothetical protein